ncbi:Gfo/Idh/MocA family oxidoreductase [Flavobacteriaceae bacterium]|nr:Gfo/Idh/MocA family oxidoreductase [Flavobacteriaceae bacterium]
MKKHRRKFLGTAATILTASLAYPNSGFSILDLKNSHTVRIGVIGVGDRGNGLLRIFSKMEGVVIVGLCDTLPFRLKEASRITPKAKTYNSHLDLMENKDLDAVIITTPLNTHAEIASDAVDANLHIYCEKTMVKGAKETIDLVKKVLSKHKKVFQTGHQYHSSRLYSHAVDLIQGGKIGKVTSIRAQWNRNGNWRRPVPDPKLERQINWRMYREYSFGLLAELSSHQIDFANWLLNSHPEKVSGFGGIDYWKDGRETYDNTHVIFAYPNGVKASYTCLTGNAKDDYKIHVFGDKGTMVLDYAKAWFYPEGSYVKEYGDVDGVSGATTNWEAGKGIPLNYSHTDPTQQALEDFRDSILNDVAPLSNVISGSKAAFAIDMGIRAMDQNKTIYWDKSYNF